MKNIRPDGLWFVKRIEKTDVTQMGAIAAGEAWAIEVACRQIRGFNHRHSVEHPVEHLERFISYQSIG